MIFIYQKLKNISNLFEERERVPILSLKKITKKIRAHLFAILLAMFYILFKYLLYFEDISERSIHIDITVL